MPPRPANAPAEPDYSQPGVLEVIVTKAGTTPEQAFDVTWAYDYPDEDTVRRALVAPMGIAPQRSTSRTRSSSASPRTAHPSGTTASQNEFHNLIAHA